ncbi:hypothetical protein GCM10009565_74720 [Amycolatopsis albidoflavus]
MAQAHPRGLAAGVHLAVHRVAHPLDSRFEHRHLDCRALAGSHAAQEGGQDRLRAVHSGGDVGGGDAGFDWGFRGAGDADQACFGLHEHVVGLALFPRAAGTVAGEVYRDEFRVAGAEVGGAEAQAGGCAWGQVLDEDVCLGDKPLDHVAAFVGFQVYG